MNSTPSGEEYVRQWLNSIQKIKDAPKVDPAVIKELIDIHLGRGSLTVFTAAERVRLESLLLQSRDWATEYSRQLRNLTGAREIAIS